MYSTYDCSSCFTLKDLCVKSIFNTHFKGDNKFSLKNTFSEVVGVFHKLAPYLPRQSFTKNVDNKNSEFSNFLFFLNFFVAQVEKVKHYHDSYLFKNWFYVNCLDLCEVQFLGLRYLNGKLFFAPETGRECDEDLKEDEVDRKSFDYPPEIDLAIKENYYKLLKLTVARCDYEVFGYTAVLPFFFDLDKSVKFDCCEALKSLDCPAFKCGHYAYFRFVEYLFYNFREDCYCSLRSFPINTNNLNLSDRFSSVAQKEEHSFNIIRLVKKRSLYHNFKEFNDYRRQLKKKIKIIYIKYYKRLIITLTFVFLFNLDEGYDVKLLCLYFIHLIVTQVFKNTFEKANKSRNLMWLESDSSRGIGKGPEMFYKSLKHLNLLEEAEISLLDVPDEQKMLIIKNLNKNLKSLIIVFYQPVNFLLYIGKKMKNLEVLNVEILYKESIVYQKGCFHELEHLNLVVFKKLKHFRFASHWTKRLKSTILTILEGSRYTLTSFELVCYFKSDIDEIVDFICSKNVSLEFLHFNTTMFLTDSDLMKTVKLHNNPKLVIKVSGWCKKLTREGVNKVKSFIKQNKLKKTLVIESHRLHDSSSSDNSSSDSSD